MTPWSTDMQRRISYSLLRIAACLAIVLLHTVESARLLYLGDADVGLQFASKSVVACLMWAVPVFLMVTGALLLDGSKKTSIAKVWKKYIPRGAGALLLFCYGFRVFDYFMDHEQGGFLRGVLWGGLRNALTEGSWAHLWYLYVLLGLYMLMPFFQKVAQHSTDSQLRYLLGILFLFLSLLPILEQFGYSCPISIQVDTIYPFYLFLGYAIHNRILRLNRLSSALLLVLPIAVILPAVKYGWEIGYSAFPVVLQSAGVFGLLDTVQNPASEGGWGIRLLNSFDRCSFGIYLIHMMGLRLVLRYAGWNPYQTAVPVLSFAGLWLATALASWVCIWAVRKVPGLKKIL